MRFLEDCHSCVYINVNGTCGNNKSIMFGVVTTKQDYPPPILEGQKVLRKRDLKKVQEKT